jgi:hypothetical protein
MGYLGMWYYWSTTPTSLMCLKIKATWSLNMLGTTPSDTASHPRSLEYSFYVEFHALQHTKAHFSWTLQSVCFHSLRYDGSIRAVKLCSSCSSKHNGLKWPSQYSRDISVPTTAYCNNFCDVFRSPVLTAILVNSTLSLEAKF